MLSEDGRLVIVYNGKIYNYVDLRTEMLLPVLSSAPPQKSKRTNMEKGLTPGCGTQATPCSCQKA